MELVSFLFIYSFIEWLRFGHSGSIKVELPRPFEPFGFTVETKETEFCDGQTGKDVAPQITESGTFNLDRDFVWYSVQPLSANEMQSDP